MCSSGYFLSHENHGDFYFYTHFLRCADLLPLSLVYDDFCYFRFTFLSNAIFYLFLVE